MAGAMRSEGGRILVVDDDEDVLAAARLFLKHHVGRVRTETDPGRLPVILESEVFDAILLDMNFSSDLTGGEEGFLWLRRILETDPASAVVLMTAYADLDLAVRAIKEGAVDFIEKPWRNEKLLATVASAVQLRFTRSEVHQLKSRQRQLASDLDLPFHDIIGESPAMEAVFGLVRKVAATAANVLVTGENGTGKELIARAIHRQSARATETFVKVDMGALSPTLFESELFGHVKGAFTDAREDRPGRIELATGGTLFLDEIANLPVVLQPKLLSVLQERQVTRVGANTPRAAEFRLICASNVSLPELVAEGRFRQDLLYRINTVEIRMPPLSERPEDIPVLAEHFLRAYAAKYRKRIRRIAAATFRKLGRYPWPGNVRELQHAVERAVILSGSEVLQPGDFPLSEIPRSGDQLVVDTLNLEDIEQAAISQALLKHAGNVSRASRELGLTRTSLYRRMARYKM